MQNRQPTAPETSPGNPGFHAMLPPWMFWGGIVAVAVAIMLVIIALATGVEQIRVEERPVRTLSENAPEPVSSPSG